MKKRRAKKRKFVKPATGLRSQVPVGRVGPQGVAYHKGFVYDQLRFTCLTIAHMSKVNWDMVHAMLKTIVTANQALTLPDGVNGWACQCLDQNGRVYILSYKGIEVALYFKRQLTEIKLNPGDHYPEGVMQDPSEAWQRLDIAGRSAKQANVVLTKMHERIEDENSLLTKRVNTLQQLNDKLEEEIKKKDKQIISMRSKAKEVSHGSCSRNGKSHKKGRVVSIPKRVSGSTSKVRSSGVATKRRA